MGSSVNFLKHKANHYAVEKSTFISEPPSSDMKFEAGLLEVKCVSTANDALDSFLEAILNNNIDETDTNTPIDSETDTQISELDIWIDTLAFSSGGNV